MPWYDFLWSFEADGNVEHIAEHGLTTADVEDVVRNPLAVRVSRMTGRPIAVGWTSDGRLILGVYELIDAVTVYPVTAYDIEVRP